MNNIINIKDPNVIAIDLAKKTGFKEAYKSKIAAKNSQSILPIDELITQPTNDQFPTSSLGSTPAEILAEELSSVPDIQVQNKVIQSEPEPKIEATGPFNDVQIDVENNSVDEDNDLERKERNDLVLQIISNITYLQTKLDAIGEDVINLSSLYSPTKIESAVDLVENISMPTATTIESIEPELINNEPVAAVEVPINIEPQLVETPIFEQPASPVVQEEPLTELSPFNVAGSHVNIFDEPSKGPSL